MSLRNQGAIFEKCKGPIRISLRNLEGASGYPREPGLESPAMGSPWASMENPRMSEIMDFNETHYSVRQNGGSTGSSSIRNMFPLHPVTPKRPESPYGPKYFFLQKIQFFSLLPY